MPTIFKKHHLERHVVAAVNLVNQRIYQVGHTAHFGRCDRTDDKMQVAVDTGIIGNRRRWRKGRRFRCEVAVEQVPAPPDEGGLLFTGHPAPILSVEIPKPGALGISAGRGQTGAVIVRVVIDQVLVDNAILDRSQVGQPDADVPVGGAGQRFVESTSFQ